MKLELNISAPKGLKEYIEANRIAWCQKVEYDINSDYYNIKGFKKGHNSLYPLDVQLLEDVKGKKILHLQSYLGLDSISLSRMGADVVAVDFCQDAIDFAQKLSNELRTDTQFICSSIYDIDQLNLGLFDIVYMSYGTICWLPDIDLLFEKVTQFLRAEGKVVLVDFHPLAISFNLFRESRIKYSYFNEKEKPIEIHRRGTYADINAPIETVEYNWNHSIDEIIGCFIKNGFSMNSFKEYPFVPMDGFPNLELKNDGYYHVIDSNDKYPLLFSLVVQKH